jgi:hypothetical protein
VPVNAEGRLSFSLPTCARGSKACPREIQTPSGNEVPATTSLRDGGAYRRHCCWRGGSIEAPRQRRGRAMTDTDSPPGALTWSSAAERNRRLEVWRRAVFAIFGEQTRCVRVAWVLMSLFNVKMGYAFPTNPFLAEETRMAVNKLRETLLILENGRAIIRAYRINPATGQKQRVIYPATGIVPRPALGQGQGAPSRGRGGSPSSRGSRI